ncbi:GAF domain-containing protein [Saccharopolyspora sp. K220]|uniref:GAF domain-containing protein n=1 Tax=Saccharopolyspora soli TaxID=2926618 RepID=UPI001F5944A0|nr:GAF domain-containing protein [Saccharopolyspora soli]MCI2422514.1 GAF domain-containing protein [Saccharopolyspora soli]
MLAATPSEQTCAHYGDERPSTMIFDAAPLRIDADLAMVHKLAPQREEALAHYKLGSRDSRLDDFARKAAMALGYPNAAVNIIGRTQRICGVYLESGGEFPFEEVDDLVTGFCPHVLGRVAQALPLEHVDDDPRFHTNDIVTMLGTESYVGAKLKDRHGVLLGTVCVLDKKRHTLTKNHVETIKSVADEVSKDITDPRWNDPR